MSYTVYRRDANTAAPSSVTRGIANAVASASSSAPIMGTTSSASSSSSSSNNSNDPYDYSSSAFTTSWITYLAIIVCAGIAIAMVSSRYFYIRRYYDKPSIRAYFVPRNGIHVEWLHLHIKGPTGARSDLDLANMTSMNQVYGASAGQRAERRRRRRRNRQTVGETLGPGGARIGDGDQDDGWDYDDEESGDPARGVVAQGRGDLPQYQADSGLPAYVAPSAVSTSNATSREARGGGGGGEGMDEVDALPTAAEYEALSRGNRDGTNGGLVPTYPPAVHIHGAPTSLYPAEPPPSFSRANSGISTRSRRLPPPTGTANPAATTNSNNDSRSTFESAEEEGEDHHDRRRRERRELEIEMARRQSTATASSSATKLGDDDDDVDSMKDQNAASNSKLTLGSSSSSVDKEKESDDQGKRQ